MNEAMIRSNATQLRSMHARKYDFKWMMNLTVVNYLYQTKRPAYKARESIKVMSNVRTALLKPKYFQMAQTCNDGC